MRVSSSASAGFEGVAMTSASFKSLSWRRSSADTSTPSKRVLSLANRATASITSWLTRASIASLSSVM